jgi:serine/threonine protein kinase
LSGGGSDADAATPGSTVADRYVLKAHLGTGRYGEIYEATDRLLEHSVALHLLHPRIAQQTRLLQKLQSCYQEPHLWSHTNVVTVRGFGGDHGRYFLVMDLLEGVSLRTLLDEQPAELLPEAEALAVLRGVGDALKYAHSKGAIHGDIRAQKIFVTSKHVIKVLDLLPASSPRTQPFFVEDTAGDGIAAPDPRDDVYGMACVAYELFSGARPFDGCSPLEALSAGRELAPAPRLGEQRSNALARALRLRREQRTASIEQLLGELGITGLEAPHAASERVKASARKPAPAESSPVRERAPPPRTPAVPARVQDEQDKDMPIIGDYSERVTFGKQPAPPPPPPSAEIRHGADGPVSEGPWHLDPRDVDRYAERAQRGRRRGPLGPLATVLGFAAAVLIAAGLVLAAYWNYEPLRARFVEWLAR